MNITEEYKKWLKKMKKLGIMYRDYGNNFSVTTDTKSQSELEDRFANMGFTAGAKLMLKEVRKVLNRSTTRHREDFTISWIDTKLKKARE